MPKSRIALVPPRQLEAVVAVARSGSVHAASRELGIPQPAVSRLVSATERTLGVVLFTRSRQGTQPTEVGDRVVRQITFALQALRDVAQVATEPEPIVRLGCIPRVTHVLLPHLLAQLAEGGAGFRLRVSVGTSNELTADLEAARLDFIVALRATTLPGPLTLEAEELYSERTVVVCGKANADIPKTTCSLAQLALSPWVLPKAGFHSRDLIDGLMASAGRPAIVPVIETNYFETSLSIVAATRYLALAPEFAARRFEKLKMVRIVPTRPALGSSPVMLQYWQGQRTHPAYAAFRSAVTRAARLVHKT